MSPIYSEWTRLQLAAVELQPPRGHRQLRRKQPPGEDPRPVPAPVHESQPHGRRDVVRPPFRPALDQVPPGQEHELPKHLIVVPAPEGDRLPAVGGSRVSKQGMELIHGKHGSVPRACHGGSRRPFRAASRVRVHLPAESGAGAVTAMRRGVASHLIRDDTRTESRRRNILEQVQHSPIASLVGTPHRATEAFFEMLTLCPLGVAHSTAPAVRRKVEAVDEPAIRADGGPHGVGPVLGCGEALEVVVDDPAIDAATPPRL